MTKLAYLDCPTGLSGDMCLGALVDAGVPLTYLIETLEKLGISDEYKLWADRVQRNGQQATKVFVELVSNSDRTHRDHAGQAAAPSAHQPEAHLHRDDRDPPRRSTHAEDHRHSDHPAPHNHPLHHHAERNLPEIEALIRSAQLAPRTEAWSLAVFRRLAEAEAAVHGIPPESVHFHEVGATDAIVDIVGTCAGLDWLGVDQIYCSALPIGGGTVRAAHGRLPVPAPAVLKLWEMRQVPIYSNGIDRELVTPTGAALVTTLADQFGAPPPMTLQKVGLGAGSIHLPLPNILRLWIGTAEAGPAKKLHQANSPSKQTVLHCNAAPLATSHLLPSEKKPLQRIHSAHHSSEAAGIKETVGQQETVTVLETQIDDLNPQAIGYVMDALLRAGALDVFTQPIGMKKSRPGLLLTVICRPEQIEICEAIMFRETTTLGIRRSQQARTVLYREIETVQTVYGAIRVKVARQSKLGAVVNVQPEYEDCAEIARKTQQPWREAHRVAIAAWYHQFRESNQ
ncbi:nickel pincer cofactor biosynthesis protein LarC [Leptolyngbya sp. GB1-A1]|uniref:nickel pincer cofactor biosynthesis protein LarC n=1 Tax=Leptolyngbya sp. GB1-A1 TaxID=2933908 RepID=UPI003298C375